MQVGIIGSGDVGQALARGFVSAGHSVRIGTRSPAAGKLSSLVTELGPHASVGTFAETARFGEVVVLAVLGSVAEEAIRLAGPEQFRGKVVIDTTNPLEFRGPGNPPTLFTGMNDSLGERVQRWLPQARVVKAFNIVGNSLFYQPKLPGGPPDMLICGNDAAAKRQVTEILQSFGWPALDLGSIEAARVLEPLCPLWVQSAMTLGNFQIAFKLLRA